MFELIQSILELKMDALWLPFLENNKYFISSIIGLPFAAYKFFIKKWIETRRLRKELNMKA